MIRYIFHATKLLPYLVCQIVARHCLNACNVSTLHVACDKVGFQYDAQIIFSIIF